MSRADLMPIWLDASKHQPDDGQLAVITVEGSSWADVRRWSDEPVFDCDGAWWDESRGRWLGMRHVTHWFPVPPLKPKEPR